MKDPYKILGVPPNATDAQIKEAYRELAKKYHPDKYVNNPLADLAAEKMREINEAYDYLTKNKGAGNTSSGYSGNGGYYNGGFYGSQNTGSSGSQLAGIRKMINENRLEDAERALNGVTVRNAEWHYLMGVVKERRGWHDMAFQHFARATQLDPYNMEYRNAFNAMNSRRGAYTAGSNQYGYNNHDSCCNCDTCSSLICVDCCCEMMGGDLIPCC
ncbi:MAG: J domain-containing protein [Clostridia bacterium]|nr:J domain-containing protein [Clostridia bacterium]